MKTTSLLVIPALLFACLANHEGETAPPDNPPPIPQAPLPEQPVPQAPPPEAVESPAPQATPLRTETTAAEATAERVAASHILVVWQGAADAPPTVRRTRAEAKQRAEELLTRARSGEDFAALAKEYSDCPSGRRGGFLGGFGRGVMQKDFEDAVFALSEGDIGPLVETPFGFHVVRRDALQELHVAHILVQWQGIPRSKATRTREEASARIQDAAQRVAAGEPFEAVAKAISDGAMASRGGDLGWFTVGQFLPTFEQAAAALQPGQVSAVVETPAGFHLIKRLD